MTSIAKPYLLYVGNAKSAVLAKTAFGVRDWAREDCVGQYRHAADAVDLGLPDLAPAAAVAAGARSLIIGIAPTGGVLHDSLIPGIVEAIEAGLDIVSGLHARLEDVPAIAEAAVRHGRTLHNLRHGQRYFKAGNGKKRTGKRALMVGTDCALGKKYTALAISRAMAARGVDVTFRATGQTGIMIAGSGIAIDSVIADFIAGAAEALSPDAPADHWDVIEGQGSLFHPAYAGVTLGLLHGSQADALVLCHDPTRACISFLPDYPLPGVEEAMAAYLPLARRTNPAARFVGVSLNTSALEEAEARRIADAVAAGTGLPVCDPMRFGLEAVVERIVS